MPGPIKKFNQGGNTSSSISRQFTPEFVSKAVVEYAARKMFFSKMASREDMPENHGDTITKEIVIPMLHKDNMVDGNLDASTAKLLKYVWYVFPSVGGVLDSKYEADAYLGANAGNLDAAIAAAKTAAQARVTTLGGAAFMKSGAGNILGGDASYATAKGPLVPLPEEGGVVNLLNSSSKLVSAKMTQHGIAARYTVRSTTLDSRMKQVAREIKELARATGELKEMQIQNSLLSASEANRMIASDVAVTPVQMTAADVLDYDALSAFEQALIDNEVPTDTEIVSGTDKVDTKVIENAYVAFVHSRMLPTLRKIKGPDGVTIAWVPKSQYAAGETIMDGEAGSIGSFRFVVVPDLQVYKGAGSKVANDSTGTPGERANTYATGGYYDVFPILVVGADSFVTTGMRSQDVTANHILPKADVHNDMYGQVGGVASKWEYGFLAYRPERIRQLAVVCRRS